MKRRSFFKSTAFGSSALFLGGITSCTHQHSFREKEGENMNPADFDLNEVTVLQLQENMSSGRMTAESICQKYLDRIAQVDPLLKSVIELNPDALETARKMDGERKSGKVRSNLHGIPVMIKDNIDTGDKMQTTAGSLALEGHLAGEDAPLVRRLREAGAVLLGKTNLSEWANFRSEMSSSGWSGRGGQVRNPWSLDRSPCGSSSGTGAAVSANLCCIGIGTETNGSIVCPSGVNGLVGIKPTLGLWNRQGIIPIAHSQDTAGPMCRNITDAAILLGALASPENYDEETFLPEGEIFTDYTQFLNPDEVAGKRIGIAREMLGFHPLVDECFSQAMEILKSLGIIIAGDVKFQDRNKMGSSSYQVLLYEFKADLNRYLSAHAHAPVKSLEAIIAFNELNKDKEMPWFGQDIFVEAQAKGDLSSQEYLDALKTSKKFSQEEGIDKIMKENKLDAIVAATNGPAWTIDLVNGDHFSGSSSSPAAISGYPNITLPMGFVHGLPIGISFFGRAWSEPVLLKLAYAYEQATRHRKAPAFSNI